MSDPGPGELGISYDGISPNYDRTRKIPWEATEDVRHAATELMKLLGDELVYEPGAGTGLFLLPWHQAGHPVVGMDISEPMLSQARAKMPDAKFLNGDAVRPPAEATGCGVALVSGLLHVVPDWKKVIEARGSSQACSRFTGLSGMVGSTTEPNLT